MSLVSVIIPTYNRAHLIGRAIESVLSQTYDCFEIVIVDDASTDGTERVIKHYTDKRIRYIRSDKNMGLGAARNIGIESARGKYIAFLDDDDLFEPRKLDVQVPILDNNPEFGFVYSDGLIFNIEEPSKIELNPAVGRDSPREEFSRLFFMDPNIYVSSFLVRRACFEDVGFFNERLAHHHDGDMFLRIALKWNVTFSDYPSTRVRNHPNRMSLDRIEMNKSILQSGLKILEMYPDFKEELGDDANVRIAGLHYSIALAYLNKNQFKEAKKELELYFSYCKSVFWKARLVKFILQIPHPAIIIKPVLFFRKFARNIKK